MAWVVGAGMLLGLLFIAMGTATLRTGWLLPTARRHVTRPQLHGLGALLTGASLVLQSLLHFRVLPGVSWEVRFYGGNALLLGGMLLLLVSQTLPLRRGRDHTHHSDG
ncbi:hypothetical protein [Streptomyces cyaneofuscatus]|uniref:Uncharacterized protein n=1 Tax=Streptomyces cyaneofuscatus TaxID=66883 RepID=A0ABZ1ETC1_9ACTN|nr:hypothetical protein [Streptomyces cyaneofuscatus]WSB07392.1 hypothetical protein OG849_09070 [Streptomyces cyaneofuscatus]WSD49075.1 hypothetical protein OG857_26330 [Streptomyces cyaneofuscatus]